MTTNPFFQNGYGLGEVTEQDLAEDILIETIQIAGYDFKYIPRTEFNTDQFFREDPNSKFEKHYSIEMALEEPTSFGGQGDLFSKFGLEFTQQIFLGVARKRFREVTGMQKPDAGDLVYFPLPKILFIIDSVDDEPLNGFYNLSKLYTWRLGCSMFTWSHEDFEETIDIPDILSDMTVEKQDRDINREIVINDEANDYIDLTEENIFGTSVEDDH